MRFDIPIILSFTFVFFQCCNVLALTTISSLPYTANIANETYELSGDLSSTGAGINVTASGVTIDLKGHTLTWGTDNGHNTHGVYSVTNKSFTLYSSVAGGALMHGATTNPAGCHGVYISEAPTNPIVHDISITVKSRATDSLDPDCINCMTTGILIKRARNANIYNVVVDNQASEVINRHSVPAVGIKIESDTTIPSTAINVYGCQVQTPHAGISIAGATTGTDAVNIHDNAVNVSQVAVNAYAIGIGGPGGATNTMVGGANVYNNTITTSGSGGRGIIISHLDYFDIHNNTLTVGEAPTAESVWTNGIRSRYGARYGKIRNNIINVKCGQSGYSGGNGIRLTAQSGIDASNPLDANNSVTGNTINVENLSPTYGCNGIEFGNFEHGHGWEISDNTINTNDSAIVFNPDAGPNYIIDNLVVSNTTINRVTPVDGVTFYAYSFIDDNIGSNGTMTINCSKYNGGASASDLYAPSGTWSYSFTDNCGKRYGNCRRIITND